MIVADFRIIYLSIAVFFRLLVILLNNVLEMSEAYNSYLQTNIYTMFCYYRFKPFETNV